MLKLRPSELALLREPGEAFRQILMPVLSAVAASNEPAVLLVDALDEADPPAEQQADFDSTKATVKACGNKLLSLLVGRLRRTLPNNVKIILTTRPDACCHGIKAVIDRAFKSHGGAVFLSPGDVREFSSMTDVRQNPVANDGVLVYHAIVRDCVGSLLQALPPLVGPPTIVSVYNLYHFIFDSKMSQLASSASKNVTDLLEMLLAGQEPLSRSFLEQLGVSRNDLEQLPGWGVLFYEADHHVFLVHKSLSDWLLLEENSLSTVVGMGHRRLGAVLLSEACKASATSQPSSYCLKYAVLHLCLAGPSCRELLDNALSRWDFLRAAIKSGFGGRLIAALGAMPAEHRSRYATDTYRWLTCCIHEFEQDPTATIEEITFKVCLDFGRVHDLTFLA